MVEKKRDRARREVIICFWLLFFVVVFSNKNESKNN